MLGIEITQQALFSGVVYGLIYAVFAAGFVLVYRSTGVLNFAQGEIGAFGVALFALFHVQYGVPYWFAFVFAVVATAIIGMVIELIVVRRLFDSPRLVLLIATVGVAQLLLFLRISLPDIDAGGGVPVAVHRAVAPERLDPRPAARDPRSDRSRRSSSSPSALFMTRTSFGLAVRASASNSDTARVYGISVQAHLDDRVDDRSRVRRRHGHPGRTAARRRRRATSSRRARSRSAPSLLLRALVVALIARMQSLPMTIVGGIAVGVFERIVVETNVDDRRSVDRRPLPVHRGARARACSSSATAATTRAGRSRRRSKPIPERLRILWYVRHLPQIGFTLLFGFLRVLPLFLSQRSQEFLWTDIVIFALVAMSITPLAGWAGQLSLGQFAFVGLGALTMVVLRAGPRHPRAVRPLGHAACRWPGSRRCSVRPRVGVAAAFDHRHPRVARRAACSLP